MVKGVTDSSGNGSVTLFVNETGDIASNYVCVVGGLRFAFNVPAGAAPINLSVLRQAGAVEGSEQFNTVLSWIEQNGLQVLSQNVPYDNTDSGLTAETVKGAIDEVDTKIPQEANRISAYAEQFSEGVFENINISDYRSYKTPEPIDAVVTGITGGEELVHPKAIHIPGGFNGWSYWMAVTPYPSSNSDLENPSILVSNNLVDWQEPVGLTNPISGQPSSGFYSDPDLFYDVVKNRLICIWRGSFTPEAIAAGVSDVFYYKTSFDGVTWSTKVLMLTVPNREVNPIMIYLNGQYWLFTMMFTDDATSTQISIRKSDTILDFQGITPVTAVVSTPDGTSPWHPDIIRIGNRFIMVTDVNGASQTSIYIGESIDGLNWTFNETELLKGGGVPLLSYPSVFYRSSIIKGYGDVLAHLIIGAKGSDGWRLGYNVIKKATDFFSLPERINRLGRLKAGSSEVVLGFDTFWRANGAVGDADSGQTWSVTSGAPDIVDRKLRATTTANTRLSFDAGVSDFYLSATVEAIITEQFYIVFRSLDNNNRWRFGFAANTNGNFVLDKIVAGSLTTVWRDVRPQGSVINLGARCVGNDITIYIDGQPLKTITDAANNTETNVGVQLIGIDQRVTDIIVES